MNGITVKVIREGKKTCKLHLWSVGTEWQIGTKHCWIRVCHKCGRVEECKEFGKVQKNKKIHFSSSEVAKILGISKKWLYVLEENKKIPRAKRDSNNFRYYTNDDLKQLKKIRGERRLK